MNWIIGLIIIIIILFILLRKVSFYETSNNYRIGNIIGFWYTHSHFGESHEPLDALCAPHGNTFAEFLLKNRAGDLAESESSKILKDDKYWWDDLENYKKIYPSFNNSLRRAIEDFRGWDSIETAPNTCVVHFRVGDFLDSKTRRMEVHEIVDAMDKLPSVPDKFEILNGGKLHNENNANTTDELLKKSDDMLNDLKSKIKSKFPNSDVVIIDSKNADSDFYRMVKAPMLVTGLGSFATMAAAANENFRLTPGFTVISRENKHKDGKIYEKWVVY
jgi:hypothetical protein